MNIIRQGVAEGLRSAFNHKMFKESLSIIRKGLSLSADTENESVKMEEVMKLKKVYMSPILLAKAPMIKGELNQMVAVLRSTLKPDAGSQALKRMQLISIVAVFAGLEPTIELMQAAKFQAAAVGNDFSLDELFTDGNQIGKVLLDIFKSKSPEVREMIASLELLGINNL